MNSSLINEDALEVRIEAVVRRVLGERRVDEYSRGNEPHGRRGKLTYKAFAAQCKRIPGAVQDSGGWRVSREAWHRARSKSVPLLSVVKTEPTVEELAQRSLARAGRRAVR